MIYPRIALRSFLPAALFSLCASFALVANVLAQKAPNSALDSRENGINLYKQGNDREAIEALRRFVKQHKVDVIAWHCLGLTLSRQGKTNDARKAHEKAAKLGENLVDSLFESVTYENLGASLRPYRQLLAEAADSAEKYLELSSKPSKSKMAEWSDRAELLRDYAQLSETEASENARFKVYRPNEVTTKARVLKRPEPEYTEEARKNQVMGTVVLRAIFAFDGKIRGLRVVSGLPDGLTSRAVSAARKIRFVPAMVDGKPASQYIQIEYNFNLY